MIYLDKVSKDYETKKVLYDFSYQFNDKGFYGIKGKSGSGKTTLLNLISGITKPSHGNIYYHDDLSSIANDIFYIHQTFNLFDNITALENIFLILKIKHKPVDTNSIENTLEKLDIFKLKDIKTHQLSGGERARLSIAVALLCEARVIIADEPTASLDEENTKNVLDILKELSKNILIIMSTHQKQLLSTYCDEVINIEDNHYQESSSSQFFKKLEYTYLKQSLSTKIYVKNKVMKTQNIRRLFTGLICLLLLILLSLSFNMMSVTKTNFAVKGILENHVTGFMIRQNLYGSEYKTTYQPKPDPNVKYLNVSEQPLLSSFFETSEYIENIANYAMIDETYDTNEIGITDYTANQLKKIGVLTFDTYDALIGTKFAYNGIQLTIKKINFTDYATVIDSVTFDDNYKSSYSHYFISRKTYLNLFAIPNQDYHVEINESNVMIYVDSSLKENQLTVSTGFLEKQYPNATKRPGIGDEIKLKMGHENFYSEKTFWIKNITEGQGSTISLSSVLYGDVFYELNGFMNDNVYHKTYYVTDWANQKVLHEVIADIYKETQYLAHPNYTDIYYTYESIANFRNMLIAFSVIMMIAAILMIAYMVYHLKSANRKSFEILQLYGVGRFSAYQISMIDMIVPLFVAIIVCIPFVWYVQRFIDESIIESMKNGFSFSLFNGWMIVLSAMILILLTMIFSGITFFFKRKEEGTYIKND